MSWMWVPLGLALAHMWAFMHGYEHIPAADVEPI